MKITITKNNNNVVMTKIILQKKNEKKSSFIYSLYIMLKVSIMISAKYEQYICKAKATVHNNSNERELLQSC